MSLKFTKNKTSPICYIKISYGYSQVGSFLRFGNSQDSTSIVHIFYFILMKCTHFSILGKICIGSLGTLTPWYTFLKKVTNYLLFWNRERLIIAQWVVHVVSEFFVGILFMLCWDHLSFQSNISILSKEYS